MMVMQHLKMRVRNSAKRMSKLLDVMRAHGLVAGGTSFVGIAHGAGDRVVVLHDPSVSARRLEQAPEPLPLGRRGRGPEREEPLGGVPVGESGITIGLQAPVSTRSAWALRRACHTAHVGGVGLRNT